MHTCSHSRAHSHALTRKHTRVLTHAAESTRVSRGGCKPRSLWPGLLFSARAAWERPHSVQRSVLSLCPLLGLPQGTDARAPLCPPPSREERFQPPPAQLAAWCLAGPGDPASLEMSPGPQGPGCGDQANLRPLPSFPSARLLPLWEMATGHPRPACCKSLTLSLDPRSRFPGEDAPDLGAGEGSLTAQPPAARATSRVP